MVAIPNASSMNWFKLTGTTNELNKGLSTDFRTFTVSKQGEFNFKINNPHTTVKILNNKNEVVADASSKVDIGQDHAKLGPGTYTAVIQQQFKGVNNREYNLEITKRANPMLTLAGGAITGTAREAVGQDTGVQRHGLTVAQGGDFAINMSMPLSRWSIMTKEGKLVASGDTMDPSKKMDVLNKTFKLVPGEYQVVAVLPRKVQGEVPWRMDFIPKTVSSDAVSSVNNAGAAAERPIDKILRERESRLRQWAAEESSGTTTSA